MLFRLLKKLEQSEYGNLLQSEEKTGERRVFIDSLKYPVRNGIISVRSHYYYFLYLLKSAPQVRKARADKQTQCQICFINILTASCGKFLKTLSAQEGQETAEFTNS